MQVLEESSRRKSRCRSAGVCRFGWGRGAGRAATLRAGAGRRHAPGPRVGMSTHGPRRVAPEAKVRGPVSKARLEDPDRVMRLKRGLSLRCTEPFLEPGDLKLS